MSAEHTIELYEIWSFILQYLTIAVPIFIGATAYQHFKEDKYDLEFAFKVAILWPFSTAWGVIILCYLACIHWLDPFFKKCREWFDKFESKLNQMHPTQRKKREQATRDWLISERLKEQVPDGQNATAVPVPDDSDTTVEQSPEESEKV